MRGTKQTLPDMLKVLIEDENFSEKQGHTINAMIVAIFG
jgi:hypothetical protein